MNYDIISRSALKKVINEYIESEEDGALNMYYHGCLKSRPKNCPLKEVGNEA
jgi:hypothetical protein